MPGLRARARAATSALAQDPEQAAQLDERLAPGAWIVRHGSRARLRGRAVEQLVGGLGLDDHHADAVGDDVVQLARDPRALLGDRRPRRCSSRSRSAASARRSARRRTAGASARRRRRPATTRRRQPAHVAGPPADRQLHRVAVVQTTAVPASTTEPDQAPVAVLGTLRRSTPRRPGSRTRRTPRALRRPATRPRAPPPPPRSLRAGTGGGTPARPPPRRTTRTPRAWPGHVRRPEILRRPHLERAPDRDRRGDRRVARLLALRHPPVSRERNCGTSSPRWNTPHLGDEAEAPTRAAVTVRAITLDE